MFRLEANRVVGRSAWTAAGGLARLLRVIGPRSGSRTRRSGADGAVRPTRAFALLLLLAAAAFAQDTAVFRTNVNLVHIVATVRNRAGELAGALRKEDFTVYDNGVRQEIAVFERQTEQPLSVTLLVDVSGSTNKDLKYETDSASKFLRALLVEGNPRDAVALYSFDYVVSVLHDFTHNYSALDMALKRLHGSAGTSLYDAIFLAARDGLASRSGRKVMVIVSDGGETTSHYNVHQALQEAQLADAVIYPVVVVPITSDAGRNVGGENALTFLAQGTGGRSFLPSVGAELDRAFAAIITELRTEYFLGFYPRGTPPAADRFHRLEVRVNGPELQVSARNGYYGDADGYTVSPGARVR